MSTKSKNLVKIGRVHSEIVLRGKPLQQQQNIVARAQAAPAG